MNMTGVTRHVEQLLGDVLDLQHPAPAEGERRPTARSARGGRGAGRQSGVAQRRRPRRRAVRRRCGRVVGHGGLARRRSTRPPAVGCLGGVAGEGQEDLVQARLAEREVGDADARRATARPTRLRRPGRRRRTRADSAAGSASSCTRPSSTRASTCSASSRWSGSSSRTCSAPAPTDAFSCARRALGDDLAVVDHRDPVGELVGLVEVLRAEQHRRPVARPARGRCPTPGCGCAGRGRSSARRGTAARA